MLNNEDISRIAKAIVDELDSRGLRLREKSGQGGKPKRSDEDYVRAVVVAVADAQAALAPLRSLRAIVARVPGKTTRVRAAIAQALAQGLIRRNVVDEFECG